MMISCKRQVYIQIVFVHNIIMSRGFTRRMILSIDFKLDMLGTTNSMVRRPLASAMEEEPFWFLFRLPDP